MNQSKPFGYSLMIDMYDCDPVALDSLEIHYRLLELLPIKLGMTPMTMPVVCHAPVKFVNDQRIELYESKAGVSGWCGLVESGIQIHSCFPSRFSTIDVYSCNDFQDKIEPVKEILQRELKYQRYEQNFIPRGIGYGSIKVENQ